MATLTGPTRPSDPDDAGSARQPRRRRALAVALALVVGVAAVVLVWLQPQKLFIDDTVDDPFPVMEVAGAGDPAVTAAPTGDSASGGASTATVAGEPAVVATGSFRSLDHGTTGTAMVIELPDGSRVLRFEDFETDNGPDLRVYLSVAPADAEEGAFDDEFIDLGGLRGNIGNQNYDIPADVELDRFASVVVWCRRFSSGFGVSPLA